MHLIQTKTCSKCKAEVVFETIVLEAGNQHQVKVWSCPVCMPGLKIREIKNDQESH
jgi:formate dehydrogenase maturation protein FdhE